MGTDQSEVKYAMAIGFLLYLGIFGAEFNFSGGVNPLTIMLLYCACEQKTTKSVTKLVARGFQSLCV